MHHHHEHFWWRFFPEKELDRVYVSVAIRFFAVSLVSLFVPLYLYREMGYGLAQTLAFFVSYAAIFAGVTPLAAKFSARYGFKHSILLSVPFYLIFVLLLYFLPVVKTPLILISAFLGLSSSFYWIGMHEIFYRVSDRKHRGEEVGKRSAVSVLATLFGPLAGGALIGLAGFKLVFILTSVLLFSSAFFLFLSRDEHEPYHFSLKYLLSKEHWKDSLFFISRGMRTMAGGVVWPLFIFVILGSYLSLGIVGSVTAGASGILIWVAGKYSDKVDKRKIIRRVIGFEALAWFFRGMVNTVGQVFGATIFGAVTHGLAESPMGALEYDKAKDHVASYFVSREVFICMGRVLLLVFVLVTDSLSGGLIFNGVASLAALLF